jgi:hypothetical protein
VKYGGEAEHPGDLTHWSLVFKAECEQQAILRFQLRDRSGKGCYQLLPAYFCVGRARRFIDQQVGIDFLGDELLEPPSRLVFLQTIDLLAARSPVSVAKVVEDESSGDDDEPRRELYLRIRDVRTEPPAVVFTERLQRMGISIHCGILIVRNGAAGMENDLAVLGNELIPDIVALRRAGRTVQSRQGERKIGRAYAFSRNVLRAGWDVVPYDSLAKCASYSF